MIVSCFRLICFKQLMNNGTLLHVLLPNIIIMSFCTKNYHENWELNEYKDTLQVMYICCIAWSLIIMCSAPYAFDDCRCTNWSGKWNRVLWGCWEHFSMCSDQNWPDQEKCVSVPQCFCWRKHRSMPAIKKFVPLPLNVIVACFVCLFLFGGGVVVCSFGWLFSFHKFAKMLM